MNLNESSIIYFLYIEPSHATLKVSVVGLYLTSLTSLDLSYCTQVTDGGILSLVLPQDHIRISDQRFVNYQRDSAPKF